MLTKHEVNALNLSPTKKDFVQIWNELLDVAGKLSERWDPTSTNESDPGIVLLKALTGIADKLNYNIDKNTLEAFMPTAAQEDSMRKLCEMLGYNIKYYQSAQTKVTFKYHNTDPSVDELNALEQGLFIPKFTVVTNSDQDISYFTTNEKAYSLSGNQPSVDIECMEGQIVKCESINANNVITVAQISSDNRFYLPETQIAENGIFVYNVTSDEYGICDGTPWEKVDNLNTQTREKRVFKFGFDSYESRPYIEFPEDYSALFNDGIFVYYTRTNGVNGNISAHTLTQLELPTLAGWDKVSADSFSVDNVFAATTGANIETIKQAYNNFKKTIGTFDTLVTCRDYMNKIYNMVDETGKPEVSNILVTDIRNDLNRAITICSCDDSGIYYKEKALTESEHRETNESKIDSVENEFTKPVYFKKNESTGSNWFLGSSTGMQLQVLTLISDPEDRKAFNINKEGTVSDGGSYWVIEQIVDGQARKFVTTLPSKRDGDKIITTTIKDRKPLIDHFDLVFYPFKSYNQIRSGVRNIQSIYDDSFNYVNTGTINSLLSRLSDVDTKTIAHNFKKPRAGDPNYIGDILSINNYLRLNATIATNTKLTAEEGVLIIENIKKALANAFNMRELDFGEEIPFESIVEVIEQADARIKLVSLNEPALYTTYSVLKEIKRNGTAEVVEYAVASDWLTVTEAEGSDRFKYLTRSTFNTKEAKEIYNKLAVRNILAGRVPLFKYSSTFTPSFYEAPYWLEKDAQLTDMPIELMRQNLVNNDYNVFWSDSEDSIYTRRVLDQGLAVDEIKYSQIKSPYQSNGNVISVPNDTTLDFSFTDGALNGDADGEDGDERGGGDNAITEIKAYSEINADNSSGVISNFVLSNDEYVKLRSPNYITVKTYPAYVNYHLRLGTEAKRAAKAATASTLFDIFSTDKARNAVFEYFKDSPYKKTFTISQKISKFTKAASTGEDLCDGAGNEGKPHDKGADGKCIYCERAVKDQVQKGPIKVAIKNETDNKIDDIESLIHKSGFIRMKNPNYKATLLWDTSDGDTPGAGTGPNLDIRLDFDAGMNEYITSAGIITQIQDAVSSVIEQSRNKVKSDSDPTPILPTECAWTVSFEFECVPIEPASLKAWEAFIEHCSTSKTKTYKNIIGYKPIKENNTLFWRSFEGGYDIGKYVLESREKLLKFESVYFGLLASYPSVLHGIYLAQDLGANEDPTIISNEKDYELKSGEYLFIEYTPATVSEDGTQQTQAAIKEVLGPGQIIKPTGFENGLMDSDVYGRQGNTSFKKAVFKVNGKNEEVPLYRFAANEQVELREAAKVELSQQTLSKNSSIIYIYKNFSSPELEKAGTSSDRSYTLKDGEYIFYTDKYKADFAYYGSGTEVTLSGGATIPECDAVDIATVLDTGAGAVPWEQKILGITDKITFQEYQYVTLGPKDTIVNLPLDIDSAQRSGDDIILDENWTICAESSTGIEYLPFGADQTEKLPELEISSRPGCGWEACSMVELKASPTEEQTLRYKQGVINTGLEVISLDSGGDGTHHQKISVKDLAAAEEANLKFKTNVACNVGSNRAKISDLFVNTDNIKSFQIKVFASDEPSIVRTKPNKVVPTDTNISLVDWVGKPLSRKDLLDIWYQTSLDQIAANQTETVDEKTTRFDNALAFSVLTIPNTYGLVCFYVHYTTQDPTAKTWIEVVPGMAHANLSVINAEHDEWFTADPYSGDADRLYLNPGINCVRFNKSGKFFVKTTAHSQGILYFDDLKLVEYGTLKFVNDKGETQELPTNGLNLKQLGYFYVPESDSEAEKLDDETLARLEAALQSAFNTNVATTSKFAWKQIQEKSAPYRKSIELLDLLATDVENNSTAGDYGTPEFKTLLETYNQVDEMLTLESDLLEAVDKKKADEQLLAYISQLAPKETAQAQLYKTLENLRVLMDEEVTNRTVDQVLTSFIQNLAGGPQANLAKDVLIETKESLLLQANNDFLRDLALYINNLEGSVSGSELERLKAALESFQASFIEEKNSAVQALVTELLNRASTEDIFEMLDEIAEEAIIASDSNNYVRLDLLLKQLKSYIINRETKTIIEDIGQAITDKNITGAKTLINKLNKLSESGSDVKAITDAIDTAIAEVAKTTKNPDTIATEISAISSKVEAYATNVTSTLGSITTQLDAASTDEEAIALQAFIDTIVENDSSVIIELTDSITAKKEQYDAAKDALKSITETTTWNTISNAAYADDFKAAVAPIWSTRIAEIIKQKFMIVESNLATAILADSPETLLSDATSGELTLAILNSNISTYSSSFLSVDQKLLQLDSIRSLAEAVESMCLTEQKNKAITDLAKTLGNAVGFNSTFTSNELDKFTEYYDGLTDAKKKTLAEHKTHHIIELLEDFNNTELSTAKKAELAATLRTELQTAKALDEQLIGMIKTYMYPNLLQAKQSVDEESVYFRIAEKIEKSLLTTVTDDNGIKTAISTAKNSINALKTTFELLDLETIKGSENEGNANHFKELFATTHKALFEQIFTEAEIADLDIIFDDYVAIAQANMIALASLINAESLDKKIEAIDALSAGITVPAADVYRMLSNFKYDLEQLRTKSMPVSDADSTAEPMDLLIESQLLKQLRKTDEDRDFYYTAPVDANLSMDMNAFAEGKRTLLNPALNYDLNNINNSFVISKLDIDYLNSGIQLARSSRINY